MSNLLFQILLSCIPILSIIITSFLIPYLKTKISATQMEEISKWVTKAVQAAEVLFNTPGSGTEKRDYVIYFIDNIFLSVLHAADISKETEALLEKIKNDIAIYETEYTELSTEAKELIATLTIFITQAETKEAERISNELQRITNENNRILAEQRRETTISHTLQNITTITNNAMEATNQANSAADNANFAILIINQTNTDITNAEAIRIANESQRIDNETIRQTQEANREKSTSDSLSHIYAAITNTNSASDRANEIAADLEEKRDTGYYKGEKGEDGHNGVILNLDANCYAFEIEGDSLYLVYSNETIPPDFSIDTDGYLVIDVI